MHERGAVSGKFGDGASRHERYIVMNGGMKVRNSCSQAGCGLRG